MTKFYSVVQSESIKTKRPLRDIMIETALNSDKDDSFKKGFLAGIKLEQLAPDFNNVKSTLNKKIQSMQEEIDRLRGLLQPY